MKLSSLFCSAEFCILKLILHKIVTRSFEEQENSRITMQVKKSREQEIKESWLPYTTRGGAGVGKDCRGSVSASFSLKEAEAGHMHISLS